MDEREFAQEHVAGLAIIASHRVYAPGAFRFNHRIFLISDIGFQNRISFESVGVCMIDKSIYEPER